MDCVECRRLSAELNRMERRYSFAQEALQGTSRVHAKEFLRLKVAISEARMNLDMAVQQAKLHGLFHVSPVLESRSAA